jgi:hypothetical protein
MIDKAGFGAKYRPLSERQNQLNESIPQAQAELDVLKISQLSEEEVLAEARDLHTRWPDLPVEEKRRIVETITNRITVGDGEIEINLHYVPPPSRGSGGGSSASGGSNLTPSSSSGKNTGSLATHPQGFIAVSSCNSAWHCRSITTRIPLLFKRIGWICEIARKARSGALYGHVRSIGPRPVQSPPAVPRRLGCR